MIAIITDDLSGERQVAQRIGIPFPILYDSSTAVLRADGLYNLLPDGLATPATFVIDRSDNIR